MRSKIQSVLELAHYKVGDVAWWVVLRPNTAVSELPKEDEWMAGHHPKVLYKRGPNKALWRASSTAQLPRVHHFDFNLLTTLLTSRLVVEQFVVCDVTRSRDTGEFFYSNSDNEWMPEDSLMDSKQAAYREKLRILRMAKKWVEVNR